MVAENLCRTEGGLLVHWRQEKVGQAKIIIIRYFAFSRKLEGRYHQCAIKLINFEVELSNDD